MIEIIEELVKTPFKYCVSLDGQYYKVDKYIYKNEVCFGNVLDDWMDSWNDSYPNITNSQIIARFPKTKIKEFIKNAPIFISEEEIKEYYFALLKHAHPIIFKFFVETKPNEYTIHMKGKGDPLSVIVPVRSYYEFFPFWVISYYLYTVYPQLTYPELLFLPACFNKWSINSYIISDHFMAAVDRPLLYEQDIIKYIKQNKKAIKSFSSKTLNSWLLGEYLITVDKDTVENYMRIHSNV